MEPREEIRKRPGMYVGDVYEGSGILNMLFEIVGNAFDQYLAGRCRRVELRVDADDTITVSDDGPGIAASADELTTWLVNRTERPTADAVSAV
jgi:DNA gyrase/topoisomerase IV subunit B